MPFAFLLPWATFHRITQSLLEGTPLVIRFLLAIPGAILYLLDSVPRASYSDMCFSSKKKLTQLPWVMFILLMCFAAIRGMTVTWDSWKRKWRIYSAEYKSYCFLFQGASRYQWLVWGGGLHGIGDMIVIHTPRMLCLRHSLLAPVSLFPPKVRG